MIIADEPTGALDSQNTEEVLQILNQIAAQGRLVIAVTHSQHAAEAGTRIVHLADGKIDGDERLKPAYQIDKVVSPIKPQQLSWINSLKDAYKHFKYHKGRNALIIAGTAIGLFSVILFSGLGTGVNKYVDNQVNSLVNPTAITVTRHVKTSGNQQQ